MLVPEGRHSACHGVCEQTRQEAGAADAAFFGAAALVGCDLGGTGGCGGGMFTTSTFPTVDGNPHASGGAMAIDTDDVPHQGPTRSV